MSSAHAVTASAIPVAEPRLVKPTTLLGIGALFLALTGVGLFLDDPKNVVFSWLIAFAFWIAISLGALLMVMIHHIFDAEWSTVLRRTFEHWLAVFPWMALLFAPLVIGSLVFEPGLLWKWLDIHDPAIAGDILWEKKKAFLNPTAFVVGTVLFFGAWILISRLLRKHSFAQDEDGSVAHTQANRKTAAWGLPVTALSLTFAAFYWFMSLEFHWFSTMFGVWYFASSMRAMLAFMTLLAIYLTSRGVLRGLFNTTHLLFLGNLMLAFTVFWAYVTFSQYFLIWNANIPEETFWFNLRETGNWYWIGMILIFGHFLVPFIFFLQHPLKKRNATMIFICSWILATQLLDFFFNIRPAYKVEQVDPVTQAVSMLPVPFTISPWFVTSFLAIGAICLWAFFQSLGRARCIPIRDPRIAQSLNLHE